MYTVSIPFHFPSHTGKNLIQLNQILAAMKLSSLRLRDIETYFEPEQPGIHRFGLVSGALACSLDPKGNVYQIDICSASRTIPEKKYLELWTEDYPQRQMRFFQLYNLDAYRGYLIVYQLRESP